MIRTTRPPSLHSEQGDPFSAIMRPPPAETSEDRSARLQREANAKKISDSIDEAIKQDRERLKKSKEDVKVSVLSLCLWRAPWARVSSPSSRDRCAGDGCTLETRSGERRCPNHQMIQPLPRIFRET